MTLYVPEIGPGTSMRDAALLYAAAGWYVLPIDATCKNAGSVLLKGWQFKTSRDPDQIAQWFTPGVRLTAWRTDEEGQNGHQVVITGPEIGLALHCGRSGAVVLDVDQPDALEAMPEVLRAVNEHHGPQQFTNPAMPGRGHYPLAVPDGSAVGNSTKGIDPTGRKGVDVRGRNGIIVVAPTVHSKAGHAYGWVRPGAVPSAGAYLQAVLRPPAYRTTGADAAELMAWVESNCREPDGPPCPAMCKVLSLGWPAPGDGRHGACAERQTQLVRLAEQGHHGVATALADLEDAFLAAKPGGTKEWADLLVGVLGLILAKPTAEADKGCCDSLRESDAQATFGFDYEALLERDRRRAAHLPVHDTPFTDDRGAVESRPDAGQEAEFWGARKVLSVVYQFALARGVSPWAVLGATLARCACSIEPAVVLPPLRGDHASLNLFVALVGHSGAGKSGARKVSAVAVEFDRSPGAFMSRYAEVTLGSGQGIAHAYGRYDAKAQSLMRTATSVLFALDEIDTLAGNAALSGSVLLPELRRLFMGEALGGQYVDAHKRVPIAPHTYRAGLVVGVQSNRAGVLLDDADGGTPQRFLWLPSTYPAMPEVTPDAPEPWQWERPAWALDAGPRPPTGPAMPHTADCPGATGGMCVCSTTTPDGGALGRITLDVWPGAVAEVRRQALADVRGQGNPLDGHRLLLKLKIAALLDALDGQTGVTEEGWQLAGVVLGKSDETRATVIAERHATAQQANATKAWFEAQRTVFVSDQVEATAQQRVKASVAGKLTCEWVSRSDLRRRLKATNGDRDRFDTVIDLLVGEGVAERREGAKGEQYRLKAAVTDSDE